MWRWLMFIILGIFWVGIAFAQSPSPSPQATPTLGVVINEFHPNPDKVEIYNASDTAVDISGWRLDDEGSASSYYEFPTETSLPPGKCLVVDIDLGLNNSSRDSVALSDHTKKIVDSYAYSTSPAAEQSYRRKPDGTGTWEIRTSSWTMLNETGVDCLPPPEPTATPTIAPITTPTPTATAGPTATPAPTTAPVINNIYISEAMVAPATGAKEWVELYNDNDFVVTLTDWHIDDVDSGGASPRSFDLQIGARSYAVIELSSGIFNNSGDDIRLLNAEQIQVDFASYSGTANNLSRGRTDWSQDDLCPQQPSRASTNTVCTTAQDDKKGPTPTPGRSITESNISPSEPDAAADLPEQAGDVLGISNENIGSWPELFDNPPVIASQSRPDITIDQMIEEISIPADEARPSTSADPALFFTGLMLGTMTLGTVAVRNLSSLQKIIQIPNRFANRAS